MVKEGSRNIIRQILPTPSLGHILPWHKLQGET